LVEYPGFGGIDDHPKIVEEQSVAELDWSRGSVEVVNVENDCSEKKAIAVDNSWDVLCARWM
jgi:hypothetical protein